MAVTPHQVNKDKEYIKTKKETETEEERAIRKEKEHKEKRSSKHETEEERAIRKKKEKENHHKLPRTHKETEEERAIRKEKEQKGKDKEGKCPETDEERRIRKDYKTKLSKETEELRTNKKPSKKSEEKKSSELDLKYEYTDQLICASGENCVKPNDYVVDWLDCSSCEQWFHNKCVSVDPEMAKNKKFEFYCKSCEIKRSNISKKHQERKKPRRSRNAKDEANSKINDCFKTTERSESPKKYVTTKTLNNSDKTSISPVTKSDKNSRDTSKKPIEVVTPIKKHKSNRKSETSNQAATEPKIVGTHSSISQLLQSLSEDKSKPQAKASRNQSIKTSIETTSNKSDDLPIEPLTLEVARESEMESVNETSSESLSEEIIDVESIFIDNITYTEIPSESKANSPIEPQIATQTKQSTEHKMECTTETEIEISAMPKSVPTSESINESEFVMESLSESLIESVIEASGTSFDSNEDVQALLPSNPLSESIIESVFESLTEAGTEPSMEPATEHVTELLNKLTDESPIEHKPTTVTVKNETSDEISIDQIFSEMLMPPPISPIFSPVQSSDDPDSLTESAATQLSTMPTSESQTELITRSAIKSLTNSIGESLHIPISLIKLHSSKDWN